MKASIRSIAIFCIILVGFVNQSWSATAKDELSACLAAATSGRDRIELAKWMFTLMAAHPKVVDLSNITPVQRTEIASRVGQIFTRLLTVDCKTESIAAKNANPQAFKDSFEALGKVAIVELMGNPSVTAATNEISKYIDNKAIEDALR